MKIFKAIKFNIVLSLFLCSIALTGCKKQNILEYRSYGLDYLDNKNYEEALNYFDIALKMGDGDVGELQYDLLLYKAECNFMLGNYSEVKKIYETLLLVDKNNKKYKELFNSIEKVVLCVDFKEALDSDNIDKAEELLEKIKEDKNGLLHEKSVSYNQGVLYEKRGEWKNALNAFNYYLKLYPNDENALHEVEFINAQMGR